MTIDLRSDHTKSMQAITAERAKLPAVDHNGRPIGEPTVWTINDQGQPVVVPPALEPDPAPDAA